MTDISTISNLSFLEGADISFHHGEELASEGDDFWCVNNSTLDDYSRRANLLNYPDTLAVMITAALDSMEDNVGLDIAAGSNAQALQDLINNGVLSRGLSTNFEDRRSKRVRKNPQLDHIEGNLTSPNTWRKIIDWRRNHAPQGFALVMHRPVGGLQDLPPRTYKGAAHLLLDMLAPGGIMFSQVPRSLIESPRKLTRICHGVHRRKDIAEVMVSRGGGWHIDDRDTYALILSRELEPS